jgi:hypothetical protein
MVRKTKKKTVTPFERNQDAVEIDVHRYQSFADGNNSDALEKLLNIINDVSECKDFNQQVRVLQTRRNDIKVFIH